jgi:hypothetical protein
MGIAPSHPEVLGIHRDALIGRAVAALGIGALLDAKVDGVRLPKVPAAWQRYETAT